MAAKGNQHRVIRGFRVLVAEPPAEYPANSRVFIVEFPGSAFKGSTKGSVKAGLREVGFRDNCEFVVSELRAEFPGERVIIEWDYNDAETKARGRTGDTRSIKADVFPELKTALNAARAEERKGPA